MEKWNEWFYSGRYIDEALRYLPIAEMIRKDRGVYPKILDVGSGSKGISRYIKYPVIGLDQRFNGDIAQGLIPVKGDGMMLPFRDKSFDYVLSVDNLEHIQPRLRPLLVREMLRVASRKVLLAVPCGKKAAEQDCKLDAIYLKTYGERYSFLIEHVYHGLPEESDIIRIILESAEKECVRINRLWVAPNVNIFFRYLYMSLWISRNKTLRRLHQLMMILSHFRRWLNFGDCYRKIFVIEVGE